MIFIFVWCGISGLARNSELIITTPRSEFGLDKFYKKYTDASGIPNVSSWRVPDETIVKVTQMTEFFLNILPAEVAESNKEKMGGVNFY